MIVHNSPPHLLSRGTESVRHLMINASTTAISESVDRADAAPVFDYLSPHVPQLKSEVERPSEDQCF